MSSSYPPSGAACTTTPLSWLLYELMPVSFELRKLLLMPQDAFSPKLDLNFPERKSYLTDDSIVIVRNYLSDSHLYLSTQVRKRRWMDHCP
jgi:hypothetical protein